MPWVSERYFAWPSSWGAVCHTAGYPDSPSAGPGIPAPPASPAGTLPHPGAAPVPAA